MSSFSTNNNFTRFQLARRARRKAEMKRQIADGRLVVRQMSAEELERERAKREASS